MPSQPPSMRIMGVAHVAGDAQARARCGAVDQVVVMRRA
jgi:hypothetical protein